MGQNSKYLYPPELGPVVRADVALHLEGPQDERVEDLHSVPILFVIPNAPPVLRNFQFPKMDFISAEMYTKYSPVVIMLYHASCRLTTLNILQIGYIPVKLIIFQLMVVIFWLTDYMRRI